MKTNFLDMWYGDSPHDADKIDIFFCDCDAVYRGNIYKADKIIGDYAAADSTRIEAMFSQLKINWG